MNFETCPAFSCKHFATSFLVVALISNLVSAAPTPVLEYTFNQTGPVAVGTGSTAIDLPMSKWNGFGWVSNDNHGSPGSGVSGLASDRAYHDPSLSYINLGNQDSHYMGGFAGSHPLDSVENLSALTIQGWFKTPAGQPLGIGESTLIGNMGFSENFGGWKLATRGNLNPDHVGRLSFWAGKVDFTNDFASQVVSDPVYTETDQWIFFAMTYTPAENSGEVKYYKGTTTAAVTTAGTNFTDILTNGMIKRSDSGFYIGNGGNESGEWYQGRAFNGQLDNVRVFNTVLTPSEIEMLRQGDLSPSLPGPSAAPVFVSANFDSNIVDAPLVTQGGGSGWSTNWSSNVALSGTAGTSVTVVDAGSNRAEVSTTADFGGTAFRGLSTPLADTPNNTVYIQFDAQNLNEGRRFFGLGLFNGTTERMLIGQSSNFSNWTINNMAIAAPGTVDSGIDTSTAANLLVKIEFGGQNVAELVTFWVNPDYSQAEISATNVAAKVGQFTTIADWGTIDRVRIGGGNTSGVASFAAHWIDSLTIQNNTPFQDSLLGDFNGDGVVDGADLTQWKGDFGVNGESDANDDGVSDGADFLIWQRELGMGALETPLSVTVPEPAARLLLLVAFGLTMISCRRVVNNGNIGQLRPNILSNSKPCGRL